MTAETTRLRVRVSPGAGRTALVGRHGDAWKVRVTEAPERGRANEAVLRLLAETATATLGREIDYTLGENSGQVLAAIDAALKRIDEGTYGTCVSCAEQIRYERLEATPWASLCIDCKRKAEGG